MSVSCASVSLSDRPCAIISGRRRDKSYTHELHRPRYVERSTSLTKVPLGLSHCLAYLSLFIVSFLLFARNIDTERRRKGNSERKVESVFILSLRNLSGRSARNDASDRGCA